MAIHATAIVEKGAKLGEGVTIGPYSVIGPNVRLGKGTRVMSHVVIDGFTTIGERCVLFPGACVGTVPQDKKYKGVKSFLVIGDDNVIREHVTINVGSLANSSTVVGHRNLIMIGSHIGHDCQLGSDIVIANDTALGGHVVVEDQVVIGGLSGVHQFVRIGKLAMIGGKSKAVTDVPPFSICDGHPAKFYGVNAIGLKRAGYSSKQSLLIKKALKILFASGLSLSSALKKVQEEFKGNADIDHLVAFAKDSKRGVVRI